MPPRQYPEKLTHLDILELFDNGHYILDLSSGNRPGIKSGKTGSYLYTFDNGRQRNPETPAYKWVRLYKVPKYIAINLSHLVWILHTRSPIPPGFEIHHFDEDPSNNAFDNLLCCHPLDHKKYHNETQDQKNQTPF